MLLLLFQNWPPQSHPCSLTNISLKVCFFLYNYSVAFYSELSCTFNLQPETKIGLYLPMVFHCKPYPISDYNGEMRAYKGLVISK